MADNRIYVANINWKANESDLKQFFEQNVGSVKSLTIVKDRETKKSRGFAFIEFDNPGDDKKAIAQTHEAEFMERKLVVREAENNGNR